MSAINTSKTALVLGLAIVTGGVGFDDKPFLSAERQEKPGSLEWHYAAVRDLAFSKDGKNLVWTTFGKIHILDLTTRKEFPIIEAQKDIIRALALSDEGNAAVTGGNLQIHIWNIHTGKLVRSFPSHARGTAYLCTCSDGSVLAGLGEEPGKGLTDSPSFTSVRLWNAMTGDQLKPFAQGLLGAVSVALAPDAKALAWGSHDGIVRVVNVVDGKERFNCKLGYKETRITFSHDSKLLAYGTTDGVVLLDATSGKEVMRCTRKNPTKESKVYWQLYKIAFTPDGSTVAALGLDRTIGIWDVRTGGETARFITPYVFGTEFALSPTFAISPDGNTVAGPVGSSIILKDITTGIQTTIPK